MKEYIERSDIFPNGVFFVNENNPLASLDELIKRIWSIPAADVVSKAAFDQVMWERDVAIQQLREDYGVGLGEKKPADVVERKRGEWISVAERLPELGERVLCTDGYAVFEQYRVELSMVYGIWDRGGLKSPLQDVTNWMPLPTPPKEDSNGTV